MAGAFVTGQSDIDQSQSGTVTPTLTGVTAGNILICCLSYGNSTTVSSVESSNGGGLAEGPTEEGTIWGRASIWYLANCNSGSHTVTITMSASNHWCRAALLEYSGVQTTTPLDDSNGGASVSATSIGSGNVVTSADCLFIGTGTQGGGDANMSHSLTGGTEREEVQDTSFMPISVVESPTLDGTYANTFSHDGSLNYIGTVLAAFLEAAAGATPEIIPLMATRIAL